MHYKRWQRHGYPLGGGNSRYSTPEEAFEARTMWEPNSGCLIWTGCTDGFGYGKIKVNGKMQPAHRFSYEQVNDYIPDGFFVLHKCDNPSCVNVDHLFLGTHQDNMDDMVAKDRQVTGEDHGNAKLTETDVIAIRADTRLLREIAVDYGVSKTGIGEIKRRITWKQI